MSARDLVVPGESERTGYCLTLQSAIWQSHFPRACSAIQLYSAR